MIGRRYIVGKRKRCLHVQGHIFFKTTWSNRSLAYLHEPRVPWGNWHGKENSVGVGVGEVHEASRQAFREEVSPLPSPPTATLDISFMSSKCHAVLESQGEETASRIFYLGAFRKMTFFILVNFYNSWGNHKSNIFICGYWKAMYTFNKGDIIPAL